jgi:hypothetical protein
VIILLVVPLALAWLLGYLVLRLALHRGAPARRASAFEIFLALPLGLGITSVGTFLWLALLGANTTGLFAIEGLVALTLTVVLLRRRRAGQVAVGSATEPAVARRLALALLVLAAVAATTFAAFTVERPHGAWDAVSIWNLRARFLFRGGEYWRDAFSGLLGWSHPDYPLFVPASVARLWKFMGSDMAAAPIALALGCGAAAVGLLMAALAELKDRSQALLGGILLLGTAGYMEQAASQYADVPLGLLILGALACGALADRGGTERRAQLILAGVLAGLAAWTKNEGLLFALAFVACRFAGVAAARGWRGGARDAAAVLLGLLPVLLVHAWLKLAYAPANDLMASLGSATLERLSDPARWGFVVGRFGRELLYLGGWVVGLPILLVPYALLIGRDLRGGDGTRGVMMAATLAAVAAGYVVVYVATPHDLRWHVDVSLYRLVMQLWPGALFCVLLVLRSPAQALSAVPAQSVEAPNGKR